MKKHLVLVTSLAATLLGACFLSAQSITIDTVLVGDAGNAAQSVANRNHTFAGGDGLGAVAYEYRISTTAVTNAQYAAFLNAVAASDPHGLWNADMAGNRGGIDRSGSPGSYTYSVGIAEIGLYVGQSMAQMPVNYVSFWSAARFANWLTSGDTETGMYNLTPQGIAENTITRDATAWANGGVAIASQDEWFKAAYYDPTHMGGVGGYWLFPTQSDTNPTAEAPPGGTNSANFSGAGGNSLTPGDAYSNTISYYGTLDQAGNVFEWNEEISGLNRETRGGGFTSQVSSLRSHASTYRDAGTWENNGTGFRVTSLAPIPEPSTYAAILGGLGLLFAFLRRRGRGRR